MSRAEAWKKALEAIRSNVNRKPEDVMLGENGEPVMPHVFEGVTGHQMPTADDMAESLTSLGGNIKSDPLQKEGTAAWLRSIPNLALMSAGDVMPGVQASVKDEKLKAFGKRSSPPPGPMRDKHMGLIQDFANKEFGVDLSPSGGKINPETGLRKNANEVLGEAKPDWRSGKLETQWNPDAAVHELGHVANMPGGVGLGEHQANMDKQVGLAQKAEGYGSAFRHPEEVQARSMENPLRREMGLPAATQAVEVKPGQGPRLSVGTGDPAGVRVPGRRASDAPGTQVDLIRQSRLQTPETKARMDLRRSGDLSFDPETGWAPNPDRLGGKIQDYVGNKTGSLGEAAQGQSFDQLKGQGLMPPEPPQIKNVNPGDVEAPDNVTPIGRKPDSLNAFAAAPGGWSDDDEKRFQELHSKFGGAAQQQSASGWSDADEQRFQQLHSKYGVAEEKPRFDTLQDPLNKPVDVNAAIQASYPNSTSPGTAPPRQYPDGLMGKAERFQDENPNFKPQVHDLGSQGLARVMDYPYGLGRTALADSISQIGSMTGQSKPFVSDQDVMNALKGQAPTSGEYMKKAEFPTLGTANLRGAKEAFPNALGFLPDEVTGRDALGFMMDARMGEPERPKTGLGQALESTGNDIYAKGFKKVQDTLDESPRQPVPKVAPVMQKAGFSGSMKEALPAMRDARRKFYDETKDIVGQADRAGAVPDMNTATSHAQEYVNQLKKERFPNGYGGEDREIEALQKAIDDFKGSAAKTEFKQKPEVQGYDAANEMHAAETGSNASPRTELTHNPMQSPISSRVKAGPEGWNDKVPVITEANTPTTQKPGEAVFKNPEADKITSLPVQGEHVNVPGPTTEMVNRWKQKLYKLATDRAYQEGVANPTQREFQKRLASGHRLAVEEAVGKTLGEEAKNKLIERNQDVGTLLGADKQIKVQGRKETTPNLVSKTDALVATPTGLLSHSLFHNPVADAAFILGGYGLKKGVGYLNSTKGRTQIGSGLVKAGQSGVPDAIIKRALINLSK